VGTPRDGGDIQDGLGERHEVLHEAARRLGLRHGRESACVTYTLRWQRDHSRRIDERLSDVLETGVERGAFVQRVT
jgi:hypothetical protein